MEWNDAKNIKEKVWSIIENYNIYKLNTIYIIRHICKENKLVRIN